MVSIDHLRTLCTGRIAISEALGPMTTFRVGGPADIYVEPLHAEEALAVLRYFRDAEVPVLVLGNGSNVLVSDEGFRGAAVNLEAGFSGLAYAEGIVDAGAGARLATFVDFCIAHGRAGVEMLAGIPGTLGGAVIMNAGAYGGEISDHVTDVTVVRGDAVETLPAAACGFCYRGSDLGDAIVLSARFAPPAGDPEALRARRKELLLKRNAAQPTALPNAGSIFKNPEDAYAAQLIESCGLKGFRVGGAEVSALHANFVVGSPAATAADILAVIRRVRDTVRERLGVALELEIRLVGFPPNVLDQPGAPH